MDSMSGLPSTVKDLWHHVTSLQRASNTVQLALCMPRGNWDLAVPALKQGRKFSSNLSCKKK